MMDFLRLILVGAGGLWALFGLYVLVMGLYRLHLKGNMPWPILVLGAPFVLCGVIVDILVNIFIASFVLMEAPQEWLVTSRLSRLETKHGWRGDIARWVCDNLLDPLDPTGEHCKGKR